MDLYPDHRFAASRAQQYEWMKDRYPGLFDKITSKVKTGQFIPIGATWVEMDCNIPSGESFVRQFLYGQRFFQSHFGKTCKVFWLPDTFGYSSQLPQIMKLSECDFFLTQKLSWNNINKFPHNTFVWEGLDGTGVLSHFPPADTYVSEANVKDLIQGTKNFKTKDKSNTSMMLFGWGDGGGGPDQNHLERLARLKDVSGVPKVSVGHPEDFFKKVLKEEQDVPKWVGELYFELHRGTYTTHARNKLGNRQREFLLSSIEFLAAIVSAKTNDRIVYPRQQLGHLWKLLLLGQFHDVLPGTSIGLVYKDTAHHYQEISSTGERLKREALGNLLGVPQIDNSSSTLVAFNPLSWARAAIVELDESHNDGVSFYEVLASPRRNSILMDRGSIQLERGNISPERQPAGSSIIVEHQPPKSNHHESSDYADSVIAPNTGNDDSISEEAGSSTIASSSAVESSVTTSKAESSKSRTKSQSKASKTSKTTESSSKAAESSSKAAESSSKATEPSSKATESSLADSTVETTEEIVGVVSKEKKPLMLINISSVPIQSETSPRRNSLGGPRSPRVKSGMYDPIKYEVGNSCGHQLAYNGRHLAVASAPGMGFGDPILGTAEGLSVSITMSPNHNITMDNRHLTATFDSCGCLVSLYHKGTAKEAIPLGSLANTFVMFEDVPFFWDAWDVEIYHSEKPVAIPGYGKNAPTEHKAKIIETGHLRVGFEFSLDLSPISRLTQRVFLDILSDTLTFKTDVSWNENRKFLKVEFPLNIHTNQAWYSTQFGCQSRPNHKNTTWDMAKFEVCAHHWADLNEFGFGVALLNDCKYGYSCEDNVMRLSLLRSSKQPDETADMGIQSFKYGLLAHAGSHADAHLARRGLEFNQPLQIVNAAPEAKRTSFFELLQPNSSLILETVKRPEPSKAYKDGNWLILRFYESCGGRGSARIATILTVNQIHLVNVLEKVIKDAPLQPTHEYGIITIPYQPFEITISNILLSFFVSHVFFIYKNQQL